MMERCANLGEKIAKDFGERQWGWLCKAGRGVVRGAIECQACRLEPNSPYRERLIQVSTPTNNRMSEARPTPWKGPEGDCVHLGLEIPGKQRDLLGLPHDKRWHHCKKGYGIVCPCGACQNCHEREIDTDLTPRHLLYHLYPIRGNGVWQRNLDQLLERIDLFDGVRSIGVVIDKETDSIEAVKSYFGSVRIDHLFMMFNNQSLREIVTWQQLWASVAAESGSTFYAQSKGVTRPVNDVVSVHRWTTLLYKANLDHWPVIEKLLRRHPCVGAFKKVGHGFQGSNSEFHYSGAFFWIRNDALGDHWKSYDQYWWGNEAWPGLHFRAQDAGCQFGEGTVPSLDLYRLDQVERYEQEYERWCAESAAKMN